MNEWWSTLALEQQVYWSIALVATMLVVLQTAMMFLGDVTELVDAGDADAGGPEEHPSGVHLLSSRTVVAFFVGFGWTGVIATDGGTGFGLVPVVATLGGLLFGAVIFYLMRFLHSLRHSGSLDYANALGEVGTVYLPIPAAMAGQGRIQVMIQGRLKVVQALTRHRDALANRARVRVVELLDETTLVVEPLAEADTTPED